jgi:aspartyl-tRNA(Asn)/glutamyl-tRNA(Gln) amidotransferase subunit B
MITPEIRSKYTVTIGIECHVQLKTATKLFAAVGNDAREAPPNTLVSHICFGLPGALPVLNVQAVTLATKAAFALGTEPERFSKFDRKHYFYPDLPKGYQISQYDQPIIGKGSMDIVVDGVVKSIGITRAHLEEDAGKSTHPAGKDFSLVDLNRAGTPLLEIVSEPDMHSATEAKAYARELYLRMKYADVSEANLYYGNMRFDVNVSVSTTSELGTRSETKNLNSFRIVEKAVEYEVDRQIERLEKGETIVQETRGWDDAKQRTFSQRSKENADDYRYMPDPDLPPIVLTDEFVASIGNDMPELPTEIRAKLAASGLDVQIIETLIEADSATAGHGYIEVLRGLETPDMVRFAANWMVNRHLAVFQKQASDVEDGVVIAFDSLPSVEQFKAVFTLFAIDKKLNSNNADAILFDLSQGGSHHDTQADPLTVAELKGYIQNSDEDEIAAIVATVLTENAKAAEDVKNGEMKAIGFLVGQVMKQSQGKANPALAQQLIKKQLGL